MCNLTIGSLFVMYWCVQPAEYLQIWCQNPEQGGPSAGPRLGPPPVQRLLGLAPRIYTDLASEFS